MSHQKSMKFELSPYHNTSIRHNQSYNPHYNPKSKKKLPAKTIKGSIRLKTDEKQMSSSYLKSSQPNKSYIGNSYGKIIKNKKYIATESSLKERKKSKNTSSVSNLNLCKNQGKKLKVSTFTTKRKFSAIELGDKIQQKINDFRVLSNCLENYIREQRKNKNPVNTIEIIKLIKAFNRSQISHLSKPLEKLIADIIESIQKSLPVQKNQSVEQFQLKSILKKSNTQFDSPLKEKQQFQPETIEKQHKKAEDKETTVKKWRENDQHFDEKHSQKEQLLSKDVQKLEYNLQKLKYESSRLQNFYVEVTSKKQYQNSKYSQLQKLRQVAQNQQRIIKEYQSDYSSNQEHTFENQ